MASSKNGETLCEFREGTVNNRGMLGKGSAMSSVKGWLVVACPIALAVGSVIWWAVPDRSEHTASARPTRYENASAAPRQITMDQLLQLADDAHTNMIATVDDYTARFVKQEQDLNGKLGDTTEMSMKVQTAHQGGESGTPMRVYLKFLAPDRVAGREVIWGADLHDGKLVVREVGLLGNIPISLDPNGAIAMRNQRYPIMEIGLTKLIEKLIERGEPDRNDETIKVTLNQNPQLDELPVWLIRLERSEPVEGDNDFSLAEILFDPQRKLVLSYRSFGWPEGDNNTPPLIESYTYHNVETNVGLTDLDFDPDNPEYDFP